MTDVIPVAYVAVAFLSIISALAAVAMYSLGRMDERAQGVKGEP